jgi:hypothetical protein
MLSDQSWEVVQKTSIQAFWDVILCCWLSMVPSIPLKCLAVTSPVTQHHIPEGSIPVSTASYTCCFKDLVTHLYTLVYEPSPHSLQLLHYSANQVFICTVCEIYWFLYCQILSFKLKVYSFCIMWVLLILYSVETSQLSAALFDP